MDFTSTDLIYTLLACGAAIWMGVRLAKKQADVYKIKADTNSTLPSVNHVDYGDMRFLHLGTPWVQGSMKISKPFEIHLEYVQRMMGWLLFTDLDQVQHLKAMQLGLGAAALTKFCNLQLGMYTTAVELNPNVISTCRRLFHLPNDNARLQVLLANAGEVVRQEIWHGTIDALQVDLYDHEAASPVLNSEAFYADCKKTLSKQGCMVVNLYGRHANIDSSIQTIARVFGKDNVWAFKPTTAGNTIVLAFQTARQLEKHDLVDIAKKIQLKWSIPTEKWAKALAPIHIALT